MGRKCGSREEAMATFVSKAAKKLRDSNQLVKVMQIFARSSRFGQTQCGYIHQTIELPDATTYTPALLHAASISLGHIFKPDIRYSKFGVIFLELTPKEQVQYSLFNKMDTSDGH